MKKYVSVTGVAATTLGALQGCGTEPTPTELRSFEENLRSECGLDASVEIDDATLLALMGKNIRENGASICVSEELANTSHGIRVEF